MGAACGLRDDPTRLLFGRREQVEERAAGNARKHEVCVSRCWPLFNLITEPFVAFMKQPHQMPLTFSAATQ